MAKTLRELMTERGITATAEWADDNPNMADMPAGSTHWKVTFQRGGNRASGPRRTMRTSFSMGPAHSGEPKADRVLDCLLADASGADESFEDWCGNYGFDTDSRKAERTYKAVQRQTDKLKRFLGDDFEVFMEAERL